MSYGRRWSAMSLLLLLSIPRLALAQVADDSRGKTEKVGEILAALQAEPGKRVADVGAGEGFYSLRIAQAVGPTGRVTAVDVSEKYLEKLRARIQQDNISNVDVVVGAVDDPRLAENAFDAVLIYNAYHEMFRARADSEGDLQGPQARRPARDVRTAPRQPALGDSSGAGEGARDWAQLRAAGTPNIRVRNSRATA